MSRSTSPGAAPPALGAGRHYARCSPVRVHGLCQATRDDNVTTTTLLRVPARSVDEPAPPAHSMCERCQGPHHRVLLPQSCRQGATMRCSPSWAGAWPLAAAPVPSQPSSRPQSAARARAKREGALPLGPLRRSRLRSRWLAGEKEGEVGKRERGRLEWHWRTGCAARRQRAVQCWQAQERGGDKAGSGRRPRRAGRVERQEGARAERFHRPAARGERR